MATESVPQNRNRRPQEGANRVNMIGQKIGRLTVIADAGSRGKSALWLCRCECGNEHTVTRATLRRSYSKSCGCLYNESRRLPKPRRVFHLPPGESARRRLLKSYRGAARSRGLEWSIGPDAFFALIAAPCFYCGAAPHRVMKVSGNGDIHWNGIDRVDNSIGYRDGNVVTCCHTCNHAKCDMSRDEFIAWAWRLALNLLGMEKPTRKKKHQR